MTVISAAEAALARAERAVAGSRAQNGFAAASAAEPEEPTEALTPPSALVSRKERDADRRKRGEADHSIAGLLLYALSTVRKSPLLQHLLILVKCSNNV